MSPWIHIQFSIYRKLPNIYNKLLCDQVGILKTGFIHITGTIGYPSVKEINLDLHFTCYTKINSAWIKQKFKWNHEIFKVPEENRGYGNKYLLRL